MIKDNPRLEILTLSSLRPLLQEGIKIIGFGVLSILLGKIQFVIPSAVDGISDLREIGLVLSIFYCRKWYSFIFIGFITSLSLPPGGSFYVNWEMHSLALMSIHFLYKYFCSNLSNRITLLGIWLLISVFYFYGLLLPLLEIGHAVSKKITFIEIIPKYFEIAPQVIFEVIITVATTSIYLLYLRTHKLLQEYITDLSKSKQKAEESEQLKTAFLQNLSHEIRTPLNGIMGFSRLLETKTKANDPLREYTKLITACSDQLINIVHDIIDASQIETKQLELIYSTKSLSVFAQEIKTTFAEQAHLLSIVIGQDSNLIIHSDFYKLNRIVFHLVDNALKFSKEEIVSVQLNIINSKLSITVKDQGIGINEVNYKLIFTRFRQLDDGLNRAHSGNGLGLTIVKGFVEKLNGIIRVNSIPKQGSTFIITIPLKKESCNIKT